MQSKIGTTTIKKTHANYLSLLEYLLSLDSILHMDGAWLSAKKMGGIVYVTCLDGWSLQWSDTVGYNRPELMYYTARYILVSCQEFSCPWLCCHHHNNNAFPIHVVLPPSLYIVYYVLILDKSE